eukprot:UN31871
MFFCLVADVEKKYNQAFSKNPSREIRESLLKNFEPTMMLKETSKLRSTEISETLLGMTPPITPKSSVGSFANSRASLKFDRFRQFMNVLSKPSKESNEIDNLLRRPSQILVPSDVEFSDKVQNKKIKGRTYSNEG